MKKIILITLVVVAVSVTFKSQAQSVSLSLRGGVNITGSEGNTSLLLGTLVEFKTIDRLSIETGLMINTLGKFSDMNLYLSLPLHLKLNAYLDAHTNIYTSVGGFLGNRMMSSDINSELGYSVGMGVEIKSFLIGISFDRALRDITNNIKLDHGDYNLRIFIGVKL